MKNILSLLIATIVSVSAVFAQTEVNVTTQTSVYGTLDIKSNPPEAKVYIDGEYVGESPMCIPNLKVGEYTISVEREGFISQQKKVTVKEGMTTVNMSLPDPLQMCEVKPTFKGRDANGFSKWVSSKLRYPEYASAYGLQGRVVMRFTIDVDGLLKNIEVISSSDQSLEDEALRVVSMSPKWKPAIYNGKPVAVIYTFPVIFSSNKR